MGPEEIARARARLARSSRFDPSVPTQSRHRAVSGYHRLVATALRRQTSAVVTQVQRFADDVLTYLDAIADSNEPRRPGDPLSAHVDAALDRLARLEREPRGDAALVDLRRRVEALEAAVRSSVRVTDPTGWADEVGWPGPDLLAGNDGLDISLVAWLADRAPVLDLACGRGGRLDTLAARHIEARGIADDPGQVRALSDRGLDVEISNPVVALARTDDASLGAVLAYGLLERLEGAGVADVLGGAADKLRPVGALIVESAEPTDIEGWALEWSLDRRLRQPVHPDLVSHLCRAAGFSDVVVTPATAVAGAPVGAGSGAVRRARRYRVVATR